VVGGTTNLKATIRLIGKMGITSFPYYEITK
jgi:hypothetical protein